ncbi:putative uncharacterized protein DDB_G0282499 [Acyrthosiphon pisum]|uniref:Uncharacterized protein n=1 Tax=Acyrthosiphon pisum TaxID=7029 RepID=A0A8R2A066_ACYPI|nr:putative uncharacterized protein DDB_G0282499 [Acyrthosiphon pisum]|eukprot:XP_001943998.2 PREDICTED: putative uncharacterized protein DDB_G0282499 [Acyrthosiphon pisum]
MDQPSAPSFDPALLDMENMTSDKWYALIYTRIVQQEDIFVGDFKKKVVEIMNLCMNKPNATLESIQQDITNTINESQFEFEHQKFIDGIVGGTYEYLCQFIIKNSMENIKRTQCALNCFSSTNNLNYGAVKSYCNDNMLLQGSSKMTQVQCLSESNNNTTDSDKAIQSYMLNSNSENDANSMLSIKNTSINKMETTSFNNYRSTLQINSLTVDCTNDLPLLNNIHTDDNVNAAHSPSIIDDDEKTTEAIISLAMKIQQTSYTYDDEFDAVDINDSNVCTTNEIQTTNGLIEQNGDQNTDPLKLEEEYKIHNSLKILESLVNIEHDKLEGQKILKTENETEPNIETNDKLRFKSSKKTNIRKKKSQKLQENINKEKDEEEWLPSSDKKNCCSKNKTKTNKRKSHIEKASKKNKKVEAKNTVNNLSTSNSSCSIKKQNDEDILLALKGPSYTKKPETIVSAVRNTKSLDTTSSVGTQLVYHNTKDCLPTNEFKGFTDNIESMPHDEKKNDLDVAVNNSNVLLIKTTTVASISGSNEKDDKIKKKSSGLSGSVMKTSDYKKLYEKDRKSLFSPDVVIIKNVPLKSSKDFSNDLHIKKEDQDKKPKSKIHIKESNNKTSDKKRKLSKPKVKSTTSSPKMTHNSKSKQNNALISIEKKLSYIRSNNKCKRLKVTNSEGEVKTNAVNNTNNESNTYISENKVSDNIDTLGLQALDRTNFLENNEFGEGTSSHQQLNGVNVLENKESIKNTLELEAMSEWLRKKCELYNIKPIWIVINPNSTY